MAVFLSRILSGTQPLSCPVHPKSPLSLIVCIESDYWLFARLGSKTRHLVLFLKSVTRVKVEMVRLRARLSPESRAVGAPPPELGLPHHGYCRHKSPWTGPRPCLFVVSEASVRCATVFGVSEGSGAALLTRPREGAPDNFTDRRGCSQACLSLRDGAPEQEAQQGCGDHLREGAGRTEEKERSSEEEPWRK